MRQAALSERQARLLALVQNHTRAAHSRHPDAVAQRSIALTIEDRKLWRGPCGEWHYADLPCSRCRAETESQRGKIRHDEDRPSATLNGPLTSIPITPEGG